MKMFDADVWLGYRVVKYNTIQYNERFVISQYAQSNKTVLSRFLNALVSVMSYKSDGRMFQAAGPE